MRRLGWVPCFVGVVATALLAPCGCGPVGGGVPLASHSYMHQVPPELPAGGTWINSHGPLRLADLRGKVVWLEFGFLH